MDNLTPTEQARSEGMERSLDAQATIATTASESINNDEWLGEARLRLTLTFLQHQVSCENAERCSICTAKLDLYGIHAEICVTGAAAVLHTHGKWQIKEMFKAAASHIGAYISNVGGEETGIIIAGAVFMPFVMDVMGRLGASAVEIIRIASNGVSGSDDDCMKFRKYWTSCIIAAVWKEHHRIIIEKQRQRYHSFSRVLELASNISWNDSFYPGGTARWICRSFS